MANKPISQSSEADTAPSSSNNKQPNNMLWAFGIVVGAWAIGLMITGVIYIVSQPRTGRIDNPNLQPDQAQLGMAQFTDAQDFKEYLAESQDVGGVSFGRGFEAETTAAMGVPELISTQDMARGESLNVAKVVPERYSTTNVQVFGIDEPDTVKTDGTNLFVSSKDYYRFEGRPLPAQPIMDMVESEMISAEPRERQQALSIVEAFPPQILKKINQLDAQGELLLVGKTLVVFGNEEIMAFDVSDPNQPKELWSTKIGKGQEITSARSYGDELYLVTRRWIEASQPCPFTPLVFDDGSATVDCSQIYHPEVPVNIDATYTTMKIDPLSGKVEDKVSFVGSGGQSVVYMSPNYLYATYSYSGDMTDYFFDFISNDASDLLPQQVIDKLARLNSYELSSAAKMTELYAILEEHQRTLTDDERLVYENELENRLKSYNDTHARELETTGIVKVDLKNLNIQTTGVVPGFPLNQFSLDEYQDNLRIATTFSGGMWGSDDSASDVYVLNEELNTIGSVQNLGKTERIFGVRFMSDRGYVVTFRRIDPFYILDLSEPENPLKTGELKIPGFSSYLHPLATDQILGVGEENNKVKLSLFDVSNSYDPEEISKYSLDEYWSEVGENHHAFLQDDKHKVFFLPGSKGGYIFSYDNNELTLVKAVSEPVSRAVFIGDNLYLVGEDLIVVLNESSWEEVNRLKL